MKFIDSIKEKPRLYLVLSIVLAVIGLGAIYRNLDTLKQIAEKLILFGTRIDSINQSVVVDAWLSYGVLVVVICVIVLIVLYGRSDRQLQQAMDENQDIIKKNEARTAVAIKTLNGMMLAAAKIRSQVFPSANTPLKTIVSVKNTYLIYKTFDTEVQRVYEIKASSHPLHFWEVIIGVEAAA
ncbi:MAG: hypothetical protein HYX73_10460, partial [Acidobacteria bacterium]|nr:hypothetical protein [Acidobacteriota bacterium]